MIRKLPESKYIGEPCIITAVGSALSNDINRFPNLDIYGYCTLKDANTYIRTNLKVKKSHAYRKGDRPLLRDLEFPKAIVLVLGHYLYMEGDTYYSFFNNDLDEVVNVWELR